MSVNTLYTHCLLILPAQQCDTTAHIVECPERRTVAIPNIGKDVGQRQLHSLLVGMQNGAATVEDTVTVPTSLNVLLP